MNEFSYIWLGCMILFGILEAATVSLVSLWFVGGALGAFLASLLGAPLWLQVTVFVVVSAVLLACLRPFVKKVAQPKKEPTNFDRILGQRTNGVLPHSGRHNKGLGIVHLKWLESPNR